MALQQGYSLYGGQLTRRGVEEDPALFLQDSGKENVFDSLSRDNGGSLTVTGRHEYLDTQDLNAAFSAASRAAPGVSDAALGRLNDDLSARQRLITERISQTEKLLEEARANRDKAREELKKNSGFLAWLSGEKKALEKQLEAAEALFQAVGKQYDEQNKALADSKSFAADALRLREQGLASGGSGAASQQTLADAKTTFVRARSVLGVQDSVELESHVKALEAAGKEYERALGCRNTINVVGNCILRGAIIAGATILTAPMGGWGGFAAGVALATVGIGAVNGTKLALKAATGEKVSGADLKAAALDTLYGAGEAALCGFGGLLAGAYARAAQAGVSAARLSTAATNAGRGIALGQNLTRSVNVFSRMSSLGRVWHAARTLRTGGLCGLIASAPSTVFHTAMDFWRPVSEGGLKRPDGWRFYDVLARVGCNLGLSYVLGATGARWSAYRHALWDSATQQGRHIATRTTGYVARHMLSHTGEAVSTTVSTFLSAHLQARMMGRYLTDAEKAQIVLSGFMGLFMGSAAEQIGRRQMMQLAQSTAVTHNYANDQARRSHYESMMRGQRIDCDVETTRSPVQLCSFDRRAGRATCHTQTDLRRQNVSAEAMGSSVYRQQQLALDRQAGRPIRQTVTESRRAAADIVRSRARNQQPWEDQVVFARYLGDELDQVHSRFSQLRRARLNADSFDDASVSLLAEFSERNNRSAKGFRQPMPEDADMPQRIAESGAKAPWPVKLVRWIDKRIPIISSSKKVAAATGNAASDTAGAVGRAAETGRRIPLLGAVADETALAALNTAATFGEYALLPNGGPMGSLALMAEPVLIASGLANRARVVLQRELGIGQPLNLPFRGRANDAAYALAARAQAQEMLAVAAELQRSGQRVNPQTVAALRNMEQQANAMFQRCNLRNASMAQYFLGRGRRIIDDGTEAALAHLVRDAAQRGRNFSYPQLVESLSQTLRAGMATRGGRPAMNDRMFEAHLRLLRDSVEPAVAREVLLGLPPGNGTQRNLVQRCLAELNAGQSSLRGDRRLTLYEVHRRRAADSVRDELRNAIRGRVSLGRNDLRARLALIDEINTPVRRDRALDQLLTRTRQEIAREQGLPAPNQARIQSLRDFEADINSLRSIETRLAAEVTGAASVVGSANARQTARERMAANIRQTVDDTQQIVRPVRRIRMLDGARRFAQERADARVAQQTNQALNNPGGLPPAWQNQVNTAWAGEITAVRATQTQFTQAEAAFNAIPNTPANAAARTQARARLDAAAEARDNARSRLENTIRRQLLADDDPMLTNLIACRDAVGDLIAAVDTGAVPQRMLTVWDFGTEFNATSRAPLPAFVPVTQMMVGQPQIIRPAVSSIPWLGIPWRRRVVDVAPLQQIAQDGYRPRSPVSLRRPDWRSLTRGQGPWPLPRKEIDRVFDPV